MRVAIPRQHGDARVALTPEAVRKLAARKLQVAIESGAGVGAGHADAAYAAAGAQVLPPGSSDVWSADLVVTIQPPPSERIDALRPGAAVLGVLSPLKHPAMVRALAQRRVTSFAMEFIPRISRAQAMDVLSSQANLAGYKAVLLAADACPKIFPMLITAAGTIAPAKVFVIGAGVAGLQAIATARRLGAVVEAYDVRPEVEEQILSLGARFVKLPATTASASAAGGYAREQSDEERRRQVELMTKHVVEADAVIATAAVFGKAPPMLIPRDVVERMKPGAVLVDLAADVDAGRGNCEATQPGRTFTTERGVTLVGLTNLPALVPVHASQMYANNVVAFLSEIITREGQLQLNPDDEIQQGVLITHDGRVVKETVAKAIGWVEAAVHERA